LPFRLNLKNLLSDLKIASIIFLLFCGSSATLLGL
jgi:hypothetical protein